MNEKYFLDASYLLALFNNNDSLHKNALELKDILNSDCYINNNVLNEILTLTGRKLGIYAAKEIYYALSDSFTLLNEYNILNYNSKNFIIFEKYVGKDSNKTKLSFTDSSIILTAQEYGIKNIVTFDKEFKRVEGFNFIGI